MIQQPPPHDKTFWHAIADNLYQPPIGYTVPDLTPELLSYLDSSDSELRDDIAVETLTSWILGGYYGADDLRAMMSRWLANLRVGIGEQGTNTVLTRSFSALMLSVIAFHDWKLLFLTEEEVHTLLEAALTYCAEEQDVRGYDEALGWLHSPAHTADLLKFLARNRHTEASDHERILQAVAAKIAAPRPDVFIHSEYERLGLVVLDVVERNTLSQSALIQFVEQLKAMKTRDTGTHDVNYHGAYQNTKQFLRALYFILAHQEQPITGAYDLQDQLFEALRLFKT